MLSVCYFHPTKNVLDEDGFACICATADRFFAVGRILDMVIEKIQRQPWRAHKEHFSEFRVQ
jgi:hypothetical protein